MKDLQKLIEERASKKLNEEIGTFLLSIYNNPLLKAVENVRFGILGTERNGETMTIREILWYSKGYIYNRIYDGLLQSYIEKESKEFMEKVEQLKSDVDELLNSKEYE